ncbi:MAG: hypothetical protein C4525_08820 [Desulfarculus sp.]|jgi:hypothetical protein|nr:MAG: hypothetical protein C4525_08820 [Desulfarculus sp.]
MRLAQGLQEAYGQDILGDARLAGLLADYQEAIAQTARLTAELAVEKVCVACAARDAVCCFTGVEKRYDQYLLLLNLLLGVRLPPEAELANSCFFCGARGCRLLAKNSFCLNFFCPEIRQALGAENMARLLRQVGQELNAQFELDRVLIPWLWRRQASGTGKGR